MNNYDMLFGRARFQEDRIPDRYGAFSEVSIKKPWYYQLRWPTVVKRND